MIDNPYNQIKKSLYDDIPKELVDQLPDKWEKIGDVLTLKLKSNYDKYIDIISEKYAEILNCKTVLNEVGGISGIYRKPKVDIIYGSKNTETIHKENGIKFKLDPAKIMFSSGNMNERIRMANISKNNETVVDLFSGIGYFSIPMAVFSKPKKIFACEINTVSYEFLCENIVLNDVTSIVEPLLGDNRKTAPDNIADRVILGYLNNSHRFLPTALNCLKNQTGIIHYHDVCPNELIPKKSFKNIQKAANNHNREAELLSFINIKSYAPGINHVVLDVKIDEK
jgi:tRNA wybutosine-synthesizing protein 2